MEVLSPRRFLCTYSDHITRTAPFDDHPDIFSIVHVVVHVECVSLLGLLVDTRL